MPALPRLALLTASLCLATGSVCLLAGCGSHSPKASSSPDIIGSSPEKSIPQSNYADEESAAPASEQAIDLDTLPPLNCGESRLAGLIGKSESDQTRAAVANAAGHTLVRWVHPGEAVTMDYQPGRLNVIVDDKGTIAATRCG